MAWGPPGGGRFPSYSVGELIRTGSTRNVTRFSDPALDALADAQIREMDPAKRKLIIDKIQDYMYEVMPYAPTVSGVFYGVLSCRVKNMRANHQTTNYWAFEHAWIDPAGC